MVNQNQYCAIKNTVLILTFLCFQVEILVGWDKGKIGEIDRIVKERNWVFVGGLNKVSMYLCPIFPHCFTLYQAFPTFNNPEKEGFENIVGKGEYAGKPHFLCFLQYFQHIPKTNFSFSVTFMLLSAKCFQFGQILTLYQTIPFFNDLKEEGFGKNYGKRSKCW